MQSPPTELQDEELQGIFAVNSHAAAVPAAPPLTDNFLIELQSIIDQKTRSLGSSMSAEKFAKLIADLPAASLQNLLLSTLILKNTKSAEALST